MNYSSKFDLASKDNTKLFTPIENKEPRKAHSSIVTLKSKLDFISKKGSILKKDRVESSTIDNTSNETTLPTLQPKSQEFDMFSSVPIILQPYLPLVMCKSQTTLTLKDVLSPMYIVSTHIAYEQYPRGTCSKVQSLLNLDPEVGDIYNMITRLVGPVAQDYTGLEHLDIPSNMLDSLQSSIVAQKETIAEYLFSVFNAPSVISHSACFSEQSFVVMVDQLTTDVIKASKIELISKNYTKSVGILVSFMKFIGRFQSDHILRISPYIVSTIGRAQQCCVAQVAL